jgi:NADH:ubiquinone oxidoreductase subunit 4 (subunit M)
MPDGTPREWAVLAPLCALALFMRIAPPRVTKPMEPSVRRMVERMQSGEPVQVNSRPGNSQPKEQTASNVQH